MQGNATQALKRSILNANLEEVERSVRRAHIILRTPGLSPHLRDAWLSVVELATKRLALLKEASSRA